MVRLVLIGFAIAVSGCAPAASNVQECGIGQPQTVRDTATTFDSARATDSVARLLGHPLNPGGWFHDGYGNSWRSTGPTGTIEVDPVTYEVTRLLVSRDSRRPEGVTPSPPPGAVATAGSYARRGFAGFDALSLRTARTMDHGTFVEQEFEWRGRDGEAWLPTYLAVTLDASDNQLVSWIGHHEAVTTSTKPRVSRAEALTAGRDYLRSQSPRLDENSVTVGDLEVEDSLSCGQMLVLHVAGNNKPSNSMIGGEAAPSVMVNAQTGRPVR